VIRKVLAFLFFGLSASGVQPATDSIALFPPESDSVSHVWGRETDYWRFVKEGELSPPTGTSAGAPGPDRG
jgi:hypothetical protein